MLQRPRLMLCALVIPALLLGGCNSGEETDKISQQVSLAQSAADRAERAQKAAERAALTAGAPQSSFAEDEEATPDTEEEVADGDVSDNADDSGSGPVDKMAPPPPPPPPPGVEG